LRYGDEVRDAEAYFKNIDDEKPDAKHLTLIKTLIKEHSKPWSPEMVTDPVQDRLLDIIEAKKKKRPSKAKKPKKEEPADTPSNVVSIMDALRKSIENEKKKTP
jgi:DNA end-binding protein Ku